MHIGVCMFNTDYAIRIEELARAAEASGFESLFVPEHTHIPASRRTPFPGGGELPREYSHTLDPFVALAHAAAVTTRLKLGTGICLIIERDTITTAKEVASVDFVSNGRFLFGIGGGWNVEEMEHHGTDPKTRFKRLARLRKRARGRQPDGIRQRSSAPIRKFRTSSSSKAAAKRNSGASSRRNSSRLTPGACGTSKRTMRERP